MPERQTRRVQMDMLCPLDCAGCSMVANVVFIFDAHRKHYFTTLVKKIRSAAVPAAAVGKRNGLGGIWWQVQISCAAGEDTRAPFKAGHGQGFRAVKIALSDSTAVLD
jgi:hypothetical protein